MEPLRIFTIEERQSAVRFQKDSGQRLDDDFLERGSVPA
ncbi:MAG: hypothetical protein QOI58_3124 [Thermoanaerobaculia bacterium]|nr:hypothetical protein [Thermoanaerobaculia bacterium]